MFEYKAGEYGVSIVYVDPRYTSQRCSCCGYVARNNRRSQSWFKCRSCGHSEHADVNAAKNIRTAALDAANWIVTQQQGDPPGATRKGHVSPPYAAREKPVARTPKVGGGDDRASGAAKVTKRSRRRVTENSAL